MLLQISVSLQIWADLTTFLSYELAEREMLVMILPYLCACLSEAQHFS